MKHKKQREQSDSQSKEKSMKVTRQKELYEAHKAERTIETQKAKRKV